MATTDYDKQAAVVILNKILEAELAGVVRYTHYSFMVFGFGRIPIVKWLREQADESLLHATQAGDLITALGGHPSLGIGRLLEGQSYFVVKILVIPAFPLPYCLMSPPLTFFDIIMAKFILSF